MANVIMYRDTKIVQFGIENYQAFVNSSNKEGYDTKNFNTLEDSKEWIDQHLFNPKELTKLDIKNAVREVMKEDRKKTMLLTGLQELADFLHISYSTAWRIKKSGKINDATYQIGRTIFFNADKILEILCVSNTPFLKRRRK